MIQYRQPITFTATCPTCGASTDWIAEPIWGKGQRYHVDCGHCGPCPCEHHEES